ncbi:hypothetical protein CDD80_392 [Ophiocordyceps camponoti-rufipedis]|uniref:C2H2-type domain-containing protein n=1 Tax=Ophiocordyceps camponoti-rufipedis TaxID=2004952 RepID=A0A2C5YLP5_9HYPO|nr:hypothetical protein CDD80_392 [Ophiocordyceps camponoti-rufipedis]
MDPWVPLGVIPPSGPASRTGLHDGLHEGLHEGLHDGLHDGLHAVHPSSDASSHLAAFFDYRSAGSPSDCATLPGDSAYGSISQSFSIASASVHGGDDMLLDAHMGHVMGECRLNLDAQLAKPGYYCDECNAWVKSQGELKKHKQRHLKSHKCPYTNCPKGQRGFSTANDLVRHKRSVHGEHDLPGRSFVCPYCVPGSKGPKVWPRADNFRSHLQRSHQVELKSDHDHRQYLYRPRNDLEGVGDSLGHAASSRADKSPQSLQQAASVDPSPMTAGPEPLPRLDIDPVAFALQPTTTTPMFAAQQTPYIHPQALTAGTFSDDVLGTLAYHPPDKNWPFPYGGIDDDVSLAPTQPINHDPDWGLDGLDTVAHPEHMVSPATNPTDIVNYLRTFPKPFLQTALKGNSAPEGSASDDGQGLRCREPDCGKYFNRSCELKKHMKRHEKPYGCTFRGCVKRFGSKNDWKRHESSQHLVLEKWDCDEPGCGRVCHRRESFRNHLQKDHGMREGGSIDDRVEACRLGRHCDPRFWCGFCVDVVDIGDGRGNSWTRRCDHIDNHLSGKDGLAKKIMADWRDQEDMRPEMPKPADGEADGRDRKRPVNGGGGRRRPRKKAAKTQAYMWTLPMLYDDESQDVVLLLRVSPRAV